jgi:hypothetical protein
MVNAERITRERIRGARGIIREIVDLADEQGWTIRAKGDAKGGLLFIPPAHIKRPGQEMVYADDPGHDSGRVKSIRRNFERAGLKFPDSQEHSRVPQPQPIKLVPGERIPPADDFEALNQQVERITNALSEIEFIRNRLKAKLEKAEQLSKLLRQFNDGQ